MDIDRIAAVSQPYLLSLFRFVTGLLLFHYGVAKLFKYPPIEMFEDVTPLSLWGVAGTIEFVLGGLLLLGLLTRLAAFILSGEVDFILKCVAPDMATFQDFVTHLTAAPHVRNVRTSLVLHNSKYEAAVPLDVKGRR